MDKQERDDLKKAYKKEKDLRVRARILAVNMVCSEGFKINEAAACLMQCPDWVGMWIQRFNTDGLDGLRDLPRSGRPPKISIQEMDKIMKQASQTPTTPAALYQQIFQKTKVRLHIAHVRELMRKYGLSSKRTTSIHTNAAGKEFVKTWQRNLKRYIPRLEMQGFTLVVEDESFFIRGRTEGCRYWTPIGTPVLVPYVGSHDTVTAYGSLVADGRQFFRTYYRLNATAFVEYLKSMHRCFGKIAVITDRASPHRAKLIKDLLKENKEIKIIYLPKGSPYLNAIEECWHRAKRALLVSKHYKTRHDMRRSISEYFRTVRHSLDIKKYLARKFEYVLTNF